MSQIIFHLMVTLALLWSAWSDWRTRHVPYPLLWGLLAIGAGSALWRGQWWLVSAIAVATLTSSLIFLPAAMRRSLAGLLLFSGACIPDRLQALIVILIALFWLAYESGWIGGADAVIALSLLALFPTPMFVASLLISWGGLSALGWLARRLAPSSAFAKTVPLVVALALAGFIQLWAPFLFAVYQGLSIPL